MKTNSKQLTNQQDPDQDMVHTANKLTWLYQWPITLPAELYFVFNLSQKGDAFYQRVVWLVTAVYCLVQHLMSQYLSLWRVMLGLCHSVTDYLCTVGEADSAFRTLHTRLHWGKQKCTKYIHHVLPVSEHSLATFRLVLISWSDLHLCELLSACKLRGNTWWLATCGMQGTPYQTGECCPYWP